MIKKYGSLIIILVMIAMIVGVFVYQSNEIDKLKAMREQDKLDNINRQDSLHTAAQTAIINLAKSQQMVFEKKDSIDNSKAKKINEKITTLHISNDSMPAF